MGAGNYSGSTDKFAHFGFMVADRAHPTGIKWQRRKPPCGITISVQYPRGAYH